MPIQCQCRSRATLNVENHHHDPESIEYQFEYLKVQVAHLQKTVAWLHAKELGIDWEEWSAWKEKIETINRRTG